MKWTAEGYRTKFKRSSDRLDDYSYTYDEWNVQNQCQNSRQNAEVNRFESLDHFRFLTTVPKSNGKKPNKNHSKLLFFHSISSARTAPHRFNYRLIDGVYEGEPLKRFQIKRSLVRFEKADHRQWVKDWKFSNSNFSIARFLDLFLPRASAHGACLEFHHFHLSFLFSHSPCADSAP